MKKAELNDDEIETETENLPKAYAYYEQPVIQKIHHFYLSGAIGEPIEYVDMIYRIKTAPASDMIYIHINTEGGDLSTGLQIISAIKSSDAEVICSIEGIAYSLGSMIFLVADQFVVHDNTTMLIHNFSSGVYGKGNEQYAQADFNRKWFKTLAEDYYVPFLTKEELLSVLKDEDMWISAVDVRKRLNKMIKTINKTVIK